MFLLGHKKPIKNFNWYYIVLHIHKLQNYLTSVLQRLFLVPGKDIHGHNLLF